MYMAKGKVPCKPHFHCTIHAATRLDPLQENEGSIYGTKEAHHPLRNQTQKRHCSLWVPGSNV